jgi:hypothetical protein
MIMVDDKPSRLDLTIDPELDKQFRDMVYRKFGMKKGNLRTALEEAIKLWLSNEKDRGRKK